MKFYTYICLLLLTPLFSIAQLGDYYYSDNHPKAKGLNFQVKSPIGFEQKEAVRPNIVQKWDNISADELMSFNILVYEDESFKDYSIDDWKEGLRDKDIREDFVGGMEANASNIKYFVLDNYPGVVFDGYQEIERIDLKTRLYLIQAAVIVESYMFILQIIGNDKASINANRNLFNLMANSVVFPDQYNY